MPDEPLFGPYGGNAVEHIHHLREYSVNAVWFHGFNDRCFQACSAHGIAPCVEFKTFRADYQQHPELIPIGVNGLPIRYQKLLQGVCLSQKDFLQETESKLIQGVKSYKPTGVWFDYLSAGGWFETPDPDLQPNCFCRACIDDFCTAANIDATTPAEILARHQEAWTSHQCRRVASFGRRYTSIIRQCLPDCIIGAYMCPWTPTERNGALTRIFAQDYQLFAEFIDVFTPLIYARKSGRHPGWGCQWLTQARSFLPTSKKAQPILDVLDFPESIEAMAHCANPPWGLQLFGGASVFADKTRADHFAKMTAQMRSAFSRS